MDVYFTEILQSLGTHESGKLGDDPRSIPNNLMSYIQQVALGRLAILQEMNLRRLYYDDIFSSVIEVPALHRFSIFL